jgi:hypothetical protein
MFFRERHVLRGRLIFSSILVRWGALAAMAGGILLVVFPLLGYVRLAVPFFGVMVVGLLLVPVGMVGFHAL